MWWGRQDDDPRPGSGWSIDLPTVLAMLEAGNAGEVRAELNSLLATLMPRGCCYDCEDAVGYYEECLARYEQALVEDQGVTGETRPFLITRNHKVHVWDCPAPTPYEVQHPGTLRDFVHEPPFMSVNGYDPTAGHRRVNGDDLAGWIRARRGPKGAANFHRCKRCQPALPTVYESEFADVG